MSGTQTSGGRATPVITVVTPVYNAERYLGIAIESVLNQTFSDFEFILFDDGSTDRTPDILASYAQRDERVIVVRGLHRGYVPWLNEGIRRARGRFLARMDADDICLPTRFERQVRYLEEHPECVGIGSDVLMIDSDGAPLYTARYAHDHQTISDELWRGLLGAVCHPAATFRTDVLRAINGYREELEPAEDYDLLLRLSEVGTLANLDDVLLEYRHHHASVSYDKTTRQDDLSGRILAEARARRGLPPLTSERWQAQTVSVAARHRHWAHLAAGSGHRTTALKHLARAIRAQPLAPANVLVLGRIVTPRWLLRLGRRLLIGNRPAV